MQTLASSKEKTALIVGNSPFLKVVEHKLYYLLDLYPHSFGINDAGIHLPITYSIFTDTAFNAFSEKLPSNKLAITTWYDKIPCRNNLELYGTFVHKEGKEVVNGKELAWCGFTHDFALSYCILKGFEKVILVGSADFTGDSHALNDSKFNPSQKLILESKRFIEEVNGKYTEVLTLNPESILEVEKINIDDLLKV